MKTIVKIESSIIVTFLFLGAVFFGSCSEFSLGDSFLSQTPDAVGVNQDTVFSSKYYADQVLTTAYTSLHYPINWAQSGYDRMGGDLSDALTDLSHSSSIYAGASDYYTGAYTSATVDSSHNYDFNNSNTWMGVRYGYLVLENVDGVSDMTAQEKLRAKAEARMIIATHYADMFRHFGGVPLVTGTIAAGDDLTFPRSSVEETLNFIVDLIDSSVDDLEWDYNADPNNNGRMTAAYALGLKLRVLLFAASPLFNGEPYMEGSDDMTGFGSYDATRWQAAVAAAEEFFERNAAANGYSLNVASATTESGYRTAYRDAYFTRTSPEMILSIRRGYTNTYADSFCGNPDNFAKYQNPTLKFFELFPMSDGSDFDFDWENPNGVNPYADRDPRFYETILCADAFYIDHNCELWVGGLERPNESESTGLKLYKFSQDYTSATSIGHVDCYPAMRLPEVMLSYAEALNESNGDRTTACQMIYEVRSRVGLTTPSASTLASYSQEELREFILDERAREFGFEDVRWFDIVRWKKMECFTTPIQGINMWRSGDSTTPDDTYTYAVYGDVATARTWVNNWSAKWYLSAFPSTEIIKNYGLVQNPGW